MANTINLGPAPVLDGTVLSSMSLYIGNNRFVRIFTQSNPDEVIAIMTESTDINDPAQTLTTLKEQVLLPNLYLNYAKLTVLGNGKILLAGAVNNSTLHFYVISYDDVNSQFIVERDHDMSTIGTGNQSYSSFTQYSYIMEPYGTDTLYIMRDYGGNLYHMKYAGLDTATPAYVELGSNSTADSYYYNASSGIRFIDDKVEFVNSTSSSLSGSMYDVNTDSPIYSFQSYAARQIKMDTDKYVHLTQVGGANLSFRVGTAPFTTDFSAVSAEIAPVANYGSLNTSEDIFDVVVLDRQHLILFISLDNDTNMYARFVKIIDNNYGFLSDNSTTGSGILVCGIQNESYRRNYSDGHLVHQIDGTHFWVQSDEHEFVFLTMSV